MGLASAMSTALTGMSAAETTIDVVGNNLANSNTVAFKASTAAFSTQFLETLALGSMPTEGSGGTNPRQVGLGTMVSDITPNFNQGTLEISSNPTDLAIQGEGFYIVEGGQGEKLYTRNGNFKFNSADEMVTINGNRLLGFGVDDNFQIQRTVLQPITIPLGSSAVAQPTENVYLEGTLTPTGDVADTAEIIQSSILGDGIYSAPTEALATASSIKPNLDVIGQQTTLTPYAGGAMAANGKYTYRFAYAIGDYATTPGVQEGDYAEKTVTLGAGNDAVHLTHIPATPQSLNAGDPSPFTHVRIYRSNDQTDPNDPVSYNYLGEIDLSTVPDPTDGFTFDDTMSDAVLATRDPMDDTRLTGYYRYYVTYADTPDPQSGVAGRESRPSPLSTEININSGRAILHDLPKLDPLDTQGWQVRRIYRSLGDKDEYHFVGEISDVTSDVVYIDDRPDRGPTGIVNEKTINLEGPAITDNSLLVNVLRRDGGTYEKVFEDGGTLDFTGQKGGRNLEAKKFQITDATTVRELITFIEQATGIQKPAGIDPSIDIPIDSGSGRSPGGFVDSNGRINFVSNNGVDEAVTIPLSGMLMESGGGASNVNLPWTSAQKAKGQSAVTDFLAYDSLGIPIRVRLTAVMEKRDNTSTTYRWFADSPDNDPLTGSEIAVGTGLITFDGEGNFLSSTSNTVAIDRRHVPSASPLSFDLDFSALSGLADDHSTLAVTRQDGSAPGVLSSFLVGEDGVIRGVFSNGVTRDLGQIRLARFANPAGLEQRGENLYGEGVNSGLPVEGDPGQQGIGKIVSGALELSNTDIGGNLIDLILASTMYRGNTRVINTAQQLIDELLNMRR